MALDVPTLRARFPGVFPSTPELDAALDAAIAEAVAVVQAASLGARAEEARLYLAAHLAVVTRAGRGEGATSQAAGSVSASYGAPDLTATAYGRRYLEITRMQRGPGIMVL